MNEKVIDLARGFRRFWTNGLGMYPKYQLDLSWPSVAVVDMILSGLRGRELTPAEDELVLAASAYLTCLAHDSWMNFGQGIDVSVELKEEAPLGITLRARGGKYLAENENVHVNLTDVLRKVLRAPEDPFPFYEKTTWPLSETVNLLSPVMLGICTGLSPYIEGPSIGGGWRRLEDSSLVENIQAANDHLSHTAATYYSRVYPSETRGTDPTVFACNLIVPPLLHGEKFAGVRAVGTLCQYFEQQQISPEEREKLLLNLAQFPDPQIGAIAFIFATALAGKNPAPQLLYAAQSRGNLLPKLRPAIAVTRKLLGREGDWVSLLVKGSNAEATELFELERALGLLPLFRVEPSRYADLPYHSLLKALALGDVDESRALLSKIIDDDGVYAFDLIFQLIALDLAARDLEGADQKLRDLLEAGVYQQFTPREQSAFCELSGHLHLAQQNFSDALTFFEKALSLGAPDTPSFTTASLVAITIRLGKGDLNEALDRAKALLQRIPTCIDARIAKVLIFRNTGRYEEADQIMNDLVSDAPGHYGAFQLALSAFAAAVS